MPPLPFTHGDNFKVATDGEAMIRSVLAAGEVRDRDPARAAARIAEEAAFAAHKARVMADHGLEPEDWAEWHRLRGGRMMFSPHRAAMIIRARRLDTQRGAG